MTSLKSHVQTGYTKLDDVTAKHSSSFLKNPYLMAETFSHLQVKNDRKNRPCLFNAALTCKDFLGVALDALWEELCSWVPLLKLLPALRVEDGAYVLSGNISQADWDRLQYYSRKVKVFRATSCITPDPKVHPSTYFRIAQLQSSALFPSLRRLYYHLDDSSTSGIFFFLSPLLEELELYNIRGFENTIVGPFLATLSSQMLNRIVLRNGSMTADILIKSIVHFKQLRSLELSDAVFMSDFVLWEVLGTLPSLTNLTLEANDPTSHPAHAPENSDSQSGAPKYFESLETLYVSGSIFFIQHLLGFIDSPCLKSIDVGPVINEHDIWHEPEILLTPSMTIVASKWSRSLENLRIESGSPRCYAIPNILMLLTDLHEMQTFHINGWRMEYLDGDVRRLVKSWPKLRILQLPFIQSSISLSTLRIIAENCPELDFLDIGLDASTIPPFDTLSKSLRHKLKHLYADIVVHPHTQTTMECQIQVARYLDSIFPYLDSIYLQPEAWSGICDLVKLIQDIRRDK